MSSVLAAAGSICDERSAKAFLNQFGTSEAVRAVALRADELRFVHPKRSVGVSLAAIKALDHLRSEPQRPSLASLVWSIYGSCLRNVARLEEAEVVLIAAARMTPDDDPEARAGVARRLAYLRAEQRRPKLVRALVPLFLEWGKQVGGRTYGEELVGAGSILIRVSEFASAARLTEEALLYLTAGADRFYVSAVYNLARCRLELASTDAEVVSLAELIDEAARYVEAGTYTELRLHWLRGKRFQRLQEFDASQRSYEFARAGINALSVGMDQALLLVDLAELHLERGDPEAARQLALSSFPILKLLRTKPEAYRAADASPSSPGRGAGLSRYRFRSEPARRVVMLRGA